MWNQKSHPSFLEISQSSETFLRMTSVNLWTFWCWLQFHMKDIFTYQNPVSLRNEEWSIFWTPWEYYNQQHSCSTAVSWIIFEISWYHLSWYFNNWPMTMTNHIGSEFEIYISISEDHIDIEIGLIAMNAITIAKSHNYASIITIM